MTSLYPTGSQVALKRRRGTLSALAEVFPSERRQLGRIGSAIIANADRILLVQDESNIESLTGLSRDFKPYYAWLSVPVEEQNILFEVHTHSYLISFSTAGYIEHSSGFVAE